MIANSATECYHVPQASAADLLHVVVPIYHEQDNLPRLIAQIEEHLPEPRRVYLVYDYEADPTVPVARRLAADRPWLVPVHNDLGRGVVFALRKGFMQAQRGPVLVAMADLSDDLAVVPTMLERYRQGYGVVCASRYMPGGRQIGGPWLKRTLSRLAGLSLYWLAGLPTRDATNNFRLYDAELVRRLGVESTRGFEVAIELTTKAHRSGARITEVPSTWRDRTAGTSQFRLWKWLPAYLRWYFYGLLPLGGYLQRAGKARQKR